MNTVKNYCVKAILPLIFAMAVIFGIAINANTDVYAATFTGYCGAEETNVSYSLDTKTGVMTISGRGAMANYSSTPWAQIKDFIKSVVVEEGVTNVGDNAFNGCNYITSVTLAESVSSIGYRAFYNCTALSDITIGSNVTSIGSEAIYNTAYYNDATNWGDYVVPDSGDIPGAPVLYLGNCLIGAKSGISGIYTVREGTKCIANDAFNNRDNLTKIVIPSSVVRIGYYAFKDCDALKEIVIPEGVESIGASAFYACDALASVELPDTLKTIGADAFCHCDKISKIEIPASVEAIGSGAFYYCNAMKDVYISDLSAWCDISFENYSANPANIAGRIHLNGELIIDLVIPDGVERVGNYAFYNCMLTSITFPENEITIGEYAFANCKWLTEVVLSDNVIDVGISAFRGCSSLESMTIARINKWLDYFFGDNHNVGSGNSYFYNGIPESLKTVIFTGKNVPSEAFFFCYSIENIVLTDNVESIGNSAFAGCKDLISITLGNNVQSVGTRAFSGCTSLTKLEISENLETIGDEAFYGCSSLTKLDIPESVQSIGTQIFNKEGVEIHITDLANWCGKSFKDWKYSHKLYLNGELITDLVIPEGVTKINDYAFSYFTITDIIFPSNDITIGKYTFKSCKWLTDVVIPHTVTAVGYYAFYDCTSLESITVPFTGEYDGASGSESYFYRIFGGKDATFVPTSLKTVTFTGKALPDYAFSGCANIKNIVLTDNVGSIGNYAFGGCTSLTKLEISENLKSIGDGAFHGCSSLTKLEIPESVQSIGPSIFNKEGMEIHITDLANWCGKSFKNWQYSYKLYLNGELITDLVIPEGVTKINDYAFSYCTITDIIFPSNDITIGAYTFANCRWLTDVVIPHTVTAVGYGAFQDCTSLESITVPFTGEYDGAPEYQNRFYRIFGGNDNSVPTSLKTVTFTGNSIPRNAFSGCGNIKNIILTDNLETIGNGAFSGCSSLESVVFEKTEWWWVNNSAGAKQELFVEGEALADSATAATLLKSTYLNKYWYHISNHPHNYVPTVTAPTCTEGGYTTYVCSVCQDRYFGDHVSAIGHDYAVTVSIPTCTAKGYTQYDCRNCGDSYKGVWMDMLPHLYGSDHLCAICGEEQGSLGNGTCGEGLLWVLTAEGELMITGEGVMDDFTASSMPWSDFKDEIVKVTVSEGVKYIGAYAFYNFRAITEVSLPTTLFTIGEHAFYNARSLTEITIPESVISIGMAAFRSAGLKTARFANSTGWYAGSVKLGDAASVASSLTLTYSTVSWIRDTSEDVENTPTGDIAGGGLVWRIDASGTLYISGKGEMPDFSSDTMPWAAYRSSIIRIEIGEGITSVGRCAFYGCKSLRQVKLPATLVRIDEYGFYNCVNLTSVTVPAGVTVIEPFAFRRAGLTTTEFEVGYGWSAGEQAISVNELSGASSLGAGYLTKGYYKAVWTRDIYAEPEIADPNFVAGGMCNTTVKWTLTYIDEAKTQLKLTVSGKGAMPEYGTGAAPWYEYAASIVEIEVCEGVTTVGRCAFYNLKAVTKVTLCEGIERIGDYAFNNCKALTEIAIPESVTSIGKDAFAKTGLEVIPEV